MPQRISQLFSYDFVLCHNYFRLFLWNVTIFRFFLLLFVKNTDFRQLLLISHISFFSCVLILPCCRRHKN